MVTVNRTLTWTDERCSARDRHSCFSSKRRFMSEGCFLDILQSKQRMKRDICTFAVFPSPSSDRCILNSNGRCLSKDCSSRKRSATVRFNVLRLHSQVFERDM